MKLPLIFFGIVLFFIILVKWYKNRPEKETTKIEKKISWGWLVCVIALVFGGYYGYKYYLAGPKIAREPAIAQEWMLYWDKTPEATGFIPASRAKASRIKIEKIDNLLVFKQFYEHKGVVQTAMFVGKKTAPLVYKGRWQQDVPAGGGNFFVRFTPDMKAASGWQDNGTKRAIPMQLFAK